MNKGDNDVKYMCNDKISILISQKDYRSVVSVLALERGTDTKGTLKIPPTITRMRKGYWFYNLP